MGNSCLNIPIICSKTGTEMSLVGGIYYYNGMQLTGPSDLISKYNTGCRQSCQVLLLAQEILSKGNLHRTVS